MDGTVNDEVDDQREVAGRPAGGQQEQKEAPGFVQGGCVRSARGSHAASGACADEIVDMFAAARSRVPDHVPDAIIWDLLLLTDERVVTLGRRAPRVLLAGADDVCDALLDGVTHARRLPLVRIPAAAIGEYGWSGMQAADVVAMIVAQAERGTAISAGRRGVIAFADLDRATRRAAVEDGAWREAGAPSVDPHGDVVRLGRQFVLADLCAGLFPPAPSPHGGPVVRQGPEHLSPEAAEVRTIDPTRWVIAATAPAFAALAVDGRVADAALMEWGVVPELARRLDVRLCVPDPPVGSSLEMLCADAAVDDARALAGSFGLRLQITGAALARLAYAVDAGGLTLADARRELLTATRRLIVRALADGEQPNSASATRLALTPDDLGRLRG